MPPNTFNDLVMEFEAPGPRSQEFFDDAMEAVIDALEQRARLVEAQAGIPLAMSEAFRQGRLSRGVPPRGQTKR